MLAILEKQLKRVIRVLTVINRFYFPNLFKFVVNRVTSNVPLSVDQIVKITGKGKVSIGKKCAFGYKLGGFYRGGSIELQARFESSKICLGSNILTNNNLFICSANLISVGDYSLIGANVTIMDFEAHGIDPENRRKIGEIGEVKIGRNVWIGSNVMVLKNTIIGDNCIIAAGSVVKGNFPNNVILGGVPARIIKDIG